MSFVSAEFLALVSILFGLLVVFRQPLIRKLLLLSASCVFYAWWDWRFLGVLATVTVLDYYISQSLVRADAARKRKTLLWFSVIVNLGFLAFFKYFNFFLGTLNVFVGGLGWRADTLDIILPIGISFYTFETLSYVIDVYKGIVKPAKSLLDYAIFITFFPRLVAGPIMRATEFLPQLERGIHLDLNRFFEGTQLFMRGLLKKVVVADNLAIVVDQIYRAPDVFSSFTVWMGVCAYSVQILYDFWGYTDMARGIGRVLGIELPANFNLPYTAQSVTEFWDRWHISLSTWLRDYLYISLGGNRNGKARAYVNMMVTMLLGGLWHGASWNFIFWGGLHGAYLVIERLFAGARPIPSPWTSPRAWVKSLLVFILVTVTWVPFRSPDWETVWIVFKKLLFVDMPYEITWYYGWVILAVPLVVVGGWVARRFEWNWPSFHIRESYTLAFILLEILIVFFFAPVNLSPFIYFQF